MFCVYYHSQSNQNTIDLLVSFNQFNKGSLKQSEFQHMKTSNPVWKNGKRVFDHLPSMVAILELLKDIINKEEMTFNENNSQKINIKRPNGKYNKDDLKIQLSIFYDEIKPETISQTIDEFLGSNSKRSIDTIEIFENNYEQNIQYIVKEIKSYNTVELMDENSFKRQIARKIQLITYIDRLIDIIKQTKISDRTTLLQFFFQDENNLKKIPFDHLLISLQSIFNVINKKKPDYNTNSTSYLIEMIKDIIQFADFKPSAKQEKIQQILQNKTSDFFNIIEKNDIKAQDITYELFVNRNIYQQFLNKKIDLEKNKVILIDSPKNKCFDFCYQIVGFYAEIQKAKEKHDFLQNIMKSKERCAFENNTIWYTDSKMKTKSLVGFFDQTSRETKQSSLASRLTEEFTKQCSFNFLHSFQYPDTSLSETKCQDIRQTLSRPLIFQLDKNEVTEFLQTVYPLYFGIKHELYSKQEQKIIHDSFKFIHRPDRENIIKKLDNMIKKNNEMYLSTKAVMKSFCKELENQTSENKKLSLKSKDQSTLNNQIAKDTGYQAKLLIEEISSKSIKKSGFFSTVKRQIEKIEGQLKYGNESIHKIDLYSCLKEIFRALKKQIIGISDAIFLESLNYVSENHADYKTNSIVIRSEVESRLFKTLVDIIKSLCKKDNIINFLENMKSSGEKIDFNNKKNPDNIIPSKMFDLFIEKYFAEAAEKEIGQYINGYKFQYQKIKEKHLQINSKKKISDTKLAAATVVSAGLATQITKDDTPIRNQAAINAEVIAQ